MQDGPTAFVVGEDNVIAVRSDDFTFRTAGRDLLPRLPSICGGTAQPVFLCSSYILAYALPPLVVMATGWYPTSLISTK